MAWSKNPRSLGLVILNSTTVSQTFNEESESIFQMGMVPAFRFCIWHDFWTYLWKSVIFDVILLSPKWVPGQPTTKNGTSMKLGLFPVTRENESIFQWQKITHMTMSLFPVAGIYLSKWIYFDLCSGEIWLRNLNWKIYHVRHHLQTL